MTDYIKRGDVDTYFNNRNAWYNFYETLESIPSANVESVRHGHWEQDGHHIRCSECGTYFCRLDREGNSFPINYCPCCGARMDGEEL